MKLPILFEKRDNYVITRAIFFLLLATVNTQILKAQYATWNLTSSFTPSVCGGTATDITSTGITVTTLHLMEAMVMEATDLQQTVLITTVNIMNILSLIRVHQPLLYRV
jgi:hypothetical protein